MKAPHHLASAIVMAVTQAFWHAPAFAASRPASGPTAPAAAPAAQTPIEVRGRLQSVLGARWGQSLSEVEAVVGRRAAITEKSKDKLVVRLEQFGVEDCKLSFSFNEMGFFRCWLNVPVREPGQLAATYRRIHQVLASRLVSESTWQYSERTSVGGGADVTDASWEPFAKAVNTDIGYFSGTWPQVNALVATTSNAANEAVKEPYVWVMAEWFGMEADIPSRAVEDLFPAERP